MSNTYPWEQYPLHELEERGIATLGRGNIISKKDIQSNPGAYPIYSSSARGEGLFGSYGDYMFDEEMITWSVDGGGNLFYRPKHKFSVTNVSGFMRLDTSVLDYRFAHAALALQHSRLTFDYQTKAHPSVIRNLYHLPIPPLHEQKKIAEILSGIDFRISLGEQKISHLEMLLKSLGDKFFGNQTQYEAKTIGEIFEVSSGTTPSRTRQDYFCTNGGTPWVKTMDLTDDYVRTTDEQLTNTGIQEGRARVFPKDTLLIAMYGGWNQIGRTGILAEDSSCNQAMSALLPAQEISPEFLNLQLVIRRAYWRGVAASSRKDPNITKSDIVNMPIIIPAQSEQNEITTTLRSVIRRKSSEYQYLQSLNLLKSALASDLLSGRKRVTL